MSVCSSERIIFVTVQNVLSDNCVSNEQVLFKSNY